MGNRRTTLLQVTLIALMIVVALAGVGFTHALTVAEPDFSGNPPLSFAASKPAVTVTSRETVTATVQTRLTQTVVENSTGALDIGEMVFTGCTDLATRVMTVRGEGVTFEPEFVRTGYELGGAHYIWFWYWPYSNPGETTRDVGMIADFWQRPGGVWAIELANFDASAKHVTFDDGAGHIVNLTVSSTVFLNVTKAP